MAQTVKSTCPYCGVGCGLIVEHRPDNTWRVKGDPEHPSNKGRLCSKGVALNETIGNDNRLLYPQISGEQVDWGAALDAVAQKFKDVIDQHGPDAVAFYVSGQLLTEDYYIANKLMKGFIGSGNIDTNSRLCMASSVAGHKRAFGSDTVPGCYEDFELADLIILVGSNTAWSHPVLYRRIVRAKEKNPQLRVVVLDPRETDTCEVSDVHLALKPGTDAAFFCGLLLWLAQHGKIDKAFIQDHTEGAQEALDKALAFAPSLEAVAEYCGLPVEQIKKVYDWFLETEKSLTLYSQGVNQTSSGTDKVNAIINCHLLTARIGKPGMGPFSITGQPNAMGGREVGALANQLACHMDIENDGHRDLLGRFWQTDAVTDTAGTKAGDLFNAIKAGKIKALWVMATNPAVTLPDVSAVRTALEECEFLVVSENIHPTDTSRYADVLLPASAWAERDGTVTSSERAISRQLPFLGAPAEVKPDWWIISEIAQRMGYQGFEFEHPADIFREYAALSGFENNNSRDFDISGLADISNDEYDGMEPVQWPVPAESRTGTARMFADGRFFTPTRKAQFIAVTPQLPGNAISKEFPLVLNTARVRDQWHTMTRTGKSGRLSGHDNEPFVEINPVDAKRFDLKAGELAEVSSHWGKVIVRCRITSRQKLGEILVPMHWNDQFASAAAINYVVNPVFDPISGQPEFKHTPATIRAYRPLWHGFLLTREPIDPRKTTATYWAKARRDGLWHYELAGEETSTHWPDFARSLQDASGDAPQWAELFDESGGQYRGVSIIDGRLQSCLFIGPTHELPKRDWLVRLFSRDELNKQERLRLLAGAPGDTREDVGKTICACFNVGKNTLISAIQEKNLKTPEEIGKVLAAGTNCGSCIPELKRLIEEALATESV